MKHTSFCKGFVKSAIEIKPQQFEALMLQAQSGNEAAAQLLEKLEIANSQLHTTNQTINQSAEGINSAIKDVGTSVKDMGYQMGSGLGNQLVQRFNTGLNAAGGGLMGAGLGGGLGYWLGKGHDKNKDRSRAGAVIGGLSGAGLGTLLGAKMAADATVPRYISASPTIDGRTASQMATALQGAETPRDVFPDPWIRTTHAPAGGSTAFGPLQITGTLAKDFMTNPAKKDWINPTNRSFLTNFVAQAKQFGKFGRNPTAKGYSPRYDYGGIGDLTNATDRASYTSMGHDMVRYQMNDALKRGGNPVTEFLKNWHSRSESIPTGYSNRFTRIFSQFNGGKTNNVSLPARP